MGASLPTRERGLKLTIREGLVAGLRSLPTRERGLKLEDLAIMKSMFGRSPRGSVD